MRKVFINMAKILITGNGFDLFHHLPTKYQHFMAVMKTIENNQFKKEVSFDDLFGLEFKIDSKYDYDEIINNYNVENILFSHKKLNRIKEMLKDNLWFNYFSTVLEIETWIDFEMEIENILKQISILLKSETNQSKKVNYFRDISINYSDFNLFGIIEHKFDDKEVFSVTEKYLDKRKRQIKSKDILSDLSNSFEEFVSIFNRYLVDILGVFYENKTDNQIIPFHLINEIYTFNYTPTLENFYGIDKAKVVYLHGEIHEDSEIQNLVFGVSEIPEDVKSTKAYDFAKYYQRIKKNSNKKFIKIPLDKTNRLNETVFYIIGHSLDESDKEYILDLFKFLDFDIKGKSKICIFYHNSQDREQKLKNLFNIIDKNIIIEMNKVSRLYFVELNIKNINEQFNKQTYIRDAGIYIS
ncbi:AbiH family protein [Flavobacterium sp. XS2P14]|uniref:AbiH family protein n=1 Tax=Flavobacterium sp. XS2P14 TaxID=3401735 RepID=UPI003AAE0EDE